MKIQLLTQCQLTSSSSVYICVTWDVLNTGRKREWVGERKREISRNKQEQRDKERERQREIQTDEQTETD